MIRGVLKTLFPKPYSLLKKLSIFLKYEIFYLPPIEDVDIEINSFCNRKCKYCPNYNYEREKAFLNEKLFYKIIYELKNIGFKGKICFNMFNEPLLDLRICKFIKHIRNELPSTFIYLNTNGDFLNLSLWKELRASGLDWANVTQYDGKINANIQRLFDELNSEEKKHIGAHLLQHINNRAGLVNNNCNRELPLKEYCPYPFDHLTVNYKGKIALCCNDYFGSVEIADVRDKNISEIWRSKIFKLYRRKLALGDRNGLRLCDKCDVWGGQ